jgi:hypothetical protein
MQLDSCLMERHIFPALQLDHMQLVEAILESHIVIDFVPMTTINCDTRLACLIINPHKLSDAHRKPSVSPTM